MKESWQQQIIVLPTRRQLPHHQQQYCQLTYPLLVPDSGDERQGGVLLDRLSAELVRRGAEQLILACTEVPPALNAIDSSFLPIALDPTLALAQACVDLWQKARTDLNHL
ncbi:hypothetical protein EH228_16630 [Erwinia endophytica]|nr:hypothetical protein EH228_16630 [Erwinia endophytica]